MAKLTENTNVGTGLNIESEAPAGQYIGTCVKIIDQFGVTRKKFQSNEDIKKDVTRFVFGVYAPDNKLYIVQTFEFTISASKDANLMAFLKAWRGSEAPLGWDYCEMEGQGAAITIQHVVSKRNPSKSYAQISSIGPVFPAMAAFVAPTSMYAPLLLAASQAKPAEGTPLA